MRWIDRIPKWLLVAVAIYLAGAPFVPEPHLVQKWRMLFEGRLSRPIDIFAHPASGGADHSPVA